MITFCRGDLFETFYVAPRSFAETRREKEKKEEKLGGSQMQHRLQVSERCWEWSNLGRINDRFLLFLNRHVNLQSRRERSLYTPFKVCKWFALSHFSWRHVYDEERQSEWVRCTSVSFSRTLFSCPYSRIICHSLSSNFILLSFSFEHSVGHTVHKVCSAKRSFFICK